MEQDYKCSELKAWEKAASGHFFDDIDTCLQKLKTPHPDELARFYEDDRRAIDPLSPVISDDEDDGGEGDEEQTINDNKVNVLSEQFKQFDNLDDNLSKYSDMSDIDDIYSSSNGNSPELCPDEYARFYNIDSNKLRNTKCLSAQKYRTNEAKRLFGLLYDLDCNHSNQLLSVMAFYLKHKFSTYKVLLQDFLTGDINKQLFEDVLTKLFMNCTNSSKTNHIFDIHNQFILSLWPNQQDYEKEREQELQSFSGVDLKFFSKLYQYQKRKRTQATFSDLFHTEIPEHCVDDDILADSVDYSLQIDNLRAFGPTIHHKCPTLFLNTKHYMDQFYKQNNGFLPDATLDKQPNEQFHKQIMILSNLWLKELTYAYKIESKLKNFEKYNITKGRFVAWYNAQIRYFKYRHDMETQNRTNIQVKFVDIRIQTPNDCDEDYCPMLFSLRKLPIDKLPKFLCSQNDRKLISFHNLQLRFNRTVGKDMRSHKILFINKQAIELCHIALLKFLKNVIKELITLKPAFRNRNKKFDRLQMIDGIVPKARTEYYPDVVREIHAKSVDDILLTEEDKQFSQNLFYRSMLENEHFDLLQNPINDLDLLAAIQSSHTIIPNREVWKIIKSRLISKLSSVS